MWATRGNAMVWWLLFLLLLVNINTLLWWRQPDTHQHPPPASAVTQVSQACPQCPQCPACRQCLACPVCPVCPEALPVAAESDEISKQQQQQPAVDARAVVWYFHHIPKCAGTSISAAMRGKAPTFAKGGIVRDDGMRNVMYGLEKGQKRPMPGSVLTGHWPGGVFERYPQILSDPEHHKLFTIVRDPWDTRVSLYWYHRRWHMIPERTDIVAFMLSEPETIESIRRHGNGRPHRHWYAQQPRVINYLPYYLKCHNETHCGEVLAHYSYVGVLGVQRKNPLVPLAVLKNGDRRTAPQLRHSNVRQTTVSSKGLDYRAEMRRLDTPENRRAFRELNALDYWLYERCMERFLKDWNRLV